MQFSSKLLVTAEEPLPAVLASPPGVTVVLHSIFTSARNRASAPSSQSKTVHLLAADNCTRACRSSGSASRGAGKRSSEDCASPSGCSAARWELWPKHQGSLADFRKIPSHRLQAEGGSAASAVATQSRGQKCRSPDVYSWQPKASTVSHVVQRAVTASNQYLTAASDARFTSWFHAT